MTVSDKERQLAFDYCNKYLPGAWRDVNINQVDIYTVSGGMTNLLYRCQLIEDISLHANEPRQVLLRIYGPSKNDVRVEVEIFNQLASAGLGPRLYVTFEGGRFEEYLPSNALKWNEMTDDAIAKVMAHKIAAIHKLNVESLDKKSTWLLDRYRGYEHFLANVRDAPLEFSDFVPESSQRKAKELIHLDFKKEIILLEDLFNRIQLEPLVFSHNDLHQNNVILLHYDNMSLEDRVVLIDFEYSSYNYRTFDAANHLSEWCFDYNRDEYPYFHFSLNRFPSIEKQKQFLADYIDGLTSQNKQTNEVSRGNGYSSLSKEKMVEILFDEMQSCLMASNLLWAMWAINSALTSKIRFGYWEMAKCKWDCYLLTKKQFEHSSSQRHGGDFKVGPSKM